MEEPLAKWSKYIPFLDRKTSGEPFFDLTYGEKM